MDQKIIPNHVALIMDGNGRWAERRNLPKMAGHHAGMKAMKEIVKRSSQLGIKHLTVYAFSTENWKRSVDEVGGIFKLLVYFVDNELKELNESNVKVNILGDYAALPRDAVSRVVKTINTTKNNTGLTFNIALNYGSRHEIVQGVKRIVEGVLSGEIEKDQIGEDDFSKVINTGLNHIPDPDLIIRTSGEKRLSNFLLWEGAYSELVFSDVLWPDFTPQVYEDCITEYQQRERRLGGRLEKKDKGEIR
jgi:undecaprenyl diphosphate synthase